jgi:hypothetical protein
MLARLPRKAGLNIRKYVNQRASTSLAAHLWCFFLLSLSLDPSSSAISISGVMVKETILAFTNFKRVSSPVVVLLC